MGDAPRSRIFFPRLDSLRALCFLLVFGVHGFVTTDPLLHAHPWRTFIKGHLLGAGDLGVNVFFVLSGFLITYLLMCERRLNGRLDVPRFWLRRVLRIWPLYFVCIGFGFLLFPLIMHSSGQAFHETARPAFYLFFASNFDMLYHGPPQAGPLGVFWSIAIEEQFYLVWPLLLWITAPRWYPWLFLCVMLGSLTFNLWNASPLGAFNHTFSRAGNLAAGALAAWVFANDACRRWIAARPPAWAIALHGCMLLLFFTRNSTQYLLDASGGAWQMLFACCAALVVLYQAAQAGRWCKLPLWPPLTWLGRISFGLYCLHPIGIFCAVAVLHLAGLDQHIWHILLLQPLLALSITIALAACSYRFLERPFLRWKERSRSIKLEL